MKTLDQEEWKKSLEQNDKGQIIDVRSEEEYKEAHIPGAKLIDVQDPKNFMDHIKNLDKDQHYYIYCNSGNRGNQACLVMEHAGFEHIINLKGGIEIWNGEIAVEN